MGLSASRPPPPLLLERQDALLALFAGGGEAVELEDSFWRALAPSPAASAS